MVAASSTSSYSYYSCKLAGHVIGSPVNSSSLEAAIRSCNHQQHSACTVDYESSYGGCTAELAGIHLCHQMYCMNNNNDKRFIQCRNVCMYSFAMHMLLIRRDSSRRGIPFTHTHTSSTSSSSGKTSRYSSSYSSPRTPLSSCLSPKLTLLPKASQLLELHMLTDDDGQKARVSQSGGP